MKKGKNVTKRTLFDKLLTSITKKTISALKKWTKFCP